MPRAAATVVATTTHEVALKPAVKKRLLMECKAYAALKAQKEVLDAAMKKHRGSVEGILTELGESSLHIDGFTTTIVAPMKKKFDPKKFVQLGGDIDVYNAANIDTPQKSYVKITPPGAKEHDDE